MGNKSRRLLPLPASDAVPQDRRPSPVLGPLRLKPWAPRRFRPAERVLTPARVWGGAGPLRLPPATPPLPLPLRRAPSRGQPGPLPAPGRGGGGGLPAPSPPLLPVGGPPVGPHPAAAERKEDAAGAPGTGVRRSGCPRGEMLGVAAGMTNR